MQDSVIGRLHALIPAVGVKVRYERTAEHRAFCLIQRVTRLAVINNSRWREPGTAHLSRQ